MCYAQFRFPIEFQNKRLDYMRPYTTPDVFSQGISRKTILPNASASFKILEYTWGYSFRSTSPDMMNLIDIDNTTDPLNWKTGNRDLGNTHFHKFRFDYYKSFHNSKGMHSFNASYETIADAVSMGYDYESATGRKIYKPMNISGDNEWWAKDNVSFNFGKQNRITLDNELEYLRRTNHDFVSEDGMAMQRSRVRNLRFRDKLSLSYNINGNRISAFGTGAWNRYTGSLASFNAFNAWDINYGVTGTFKLPYNFGVTTDFTVYMRRGFNDEALNTNNYVWNARLSWSTLKGNLLFMIDGWDMLHNIKNISYTVNTQGRTETYTSVLPRYVMFHIQYQFNKQPKKK